MSVNKEMKFKAPSSFYPIQAAGLYGGTTHTLDRPSHCSHLDLW